VTENLADPACSAHPARSAAYPAGEPPGPAAADGCGGAPTKTFREVAVFLSSFEKKEIYGVALSAPPEVMYPAARARARQVSEQLRQATLERIRASGVHLLSLSHVAACM
jgi:hypothetical protein